jgi:PKD repeat protein
MMESEGNEMKGRKKIQIFLLPFILLILLFTMFIPLIYADDVVIISFNPNISDEPPYAPVNPDPPNESINVDVPVTLRVDVYDKDSITVDVYFYNASNDALIGVDYNVPCDWSTASVVWNEAIYGRTCYWYAIANDSKYENRSETWEFTTKSKPPPSSGSGGYVPPPNQPPIANITGLHIAYVNETVIFYSYYSYDPDGYIIGYNWDFENDGIIDTDWIEETKIIYKYSKPGNYTVRLQAMDNLGATSLDFHNIKIIELELPKQLPIPIIEVLNLSYTNENISFSSNGSYDPDGIIVNYTWDFDDGMISYLENPIHNFSKPGNYTVILMVRDNDDLRNGVAKKITILDKEEKPEKEPKKKREQPFLLLLLLLMIIITIILTLITMQKKYRFTLMIEKLKGSRKNKTIETKVDELLSEQNRIINKKK